MARGFTVWFTGLSGAGKSTITAELVREFEKRGVGHEVLDGDVVRTHLSKGLGFSKEDRDTNIRRIGWVASTLTKHGVGVVCAAISPYRAIRDEVRADVAKAGTFVEVYAKCPIPVLSDRDPKGLYKKALAGEIKNFTGVSDPYEEPLRPEVVVDTGQQTSAESVDAILRHLQGRGLLATPFREALVDGSELEAALDDACRLPRLGVDVRSAADVFMIGSGALAPLAGFLDQANYHSVVTTGRLVSGAPLGVPVVLRVDGD